MHFVKQLNINNADVSNGKLKGYYNIISLKTFLNIIDLIQIWVPITNGSTCCPAELYQGGRPAVYIVRVWLRKIDSEEVLLEDWESDVVLCLLVLGDFWDPTKETKYNCENSINIKISGAKQLSINTKIIKSIWNNLCPEILKH